MLRVLFAKQSDVIFNIVKDELSKFKPSILKATEPLLINDITPPKAPEAPKFAPVTQEQLDKYDPK